MSGKRNKYLGSNCKPVAKAGVAPKSNNPELSKNHSKESTMTVENTIVAEENIETTTTVVEETPVTEEVKSAIRGNAANKVSGYNWESVVGSGIVSAVGTAASMVISNKLQQKFLPEETEVRYNALEITGVTIAAGLVGAGLQAGLQCIDKINDSEQYRLVAGSVVANGVIVGGVFARDPILALVRGKISTSTEDYVTAEESAEA
ncbi:hypothetical protein PQD71_gp072 [Kosakonia phage Kc263]|uniref:Uncharacterized protein n=1 Tax=Kosakonia phage Kc263 TaxID=2863194 RepID=A0AAE7WFL0_9CAUD|nr:hypothetical protein PQD71_gp072 [Kosakonia phage Kc263]QYN79965.1 hypothetical protein [Kosakonia phage Kc263]